MYINIQICVVAARGSIMCHRFNLYIKYYTINLIYVSFCWAFIYVTFLFWRNTTARRFRGFDPLAHALFSPSIRSVSDV